jgi:hypothetical protein
MDAHLAWIRQEPKANVTNLKISFESLDFTFPVYPPMNSPIGVIQPPQERA